MQVLLYCHHDDWDVRETFDVTLKLSGLPEGDVSVRHYRIDGEHSNAYAEWLRQGVAELPERGASTRRSRRATAWELAAPETVTAEKAARAAVCNAVARGQPATFERI